MQSQLSLEDIFGPFDYSASSTAEKFLKPKAAELETYRVEFHDKEEKFRMDWFESEDKSGAENQARARHKGIRIIKTDVSSRSLAEIMELD